jgi:hypothetical protein
LGFCLALTGDVSAATSTNVADTRFSHERGFYETNFSLVISCATPGAAIYYTTNGSLPSVTNGMAFLRADRYCAHFHHSRSSGEAGFGAVECRYAQLSFSPRCSGSITDWRGASWLAHEVGRQQSGLRDGP